MGPHSFLNVFDGYAKLYSWQFPGNGSVYFSAKFVQSMFYNESLKIKDIATYQTFDDLVPPMSQLKKEEAFIRGIDNMNVNIYNYTGECVLLTDIWKLYVVDCYTLETIRSCDPPIPGDHTSFPYLSVMSVAHPVPEFGTDYHLTIRQSLAILPGISDKFTLVRVKSADIREKVAEWEVKKMPYQHSILSTERYAVIFATPLYMDTKTLLSSFVARRSLIFNKDEQTTVYVVDIKTGQEHTIQTETVFSMHYLNAYEIDNNTIFMDVASYPDGSVVAFFEMDNIMNKTKRDSAPYKPSLKRYKIDILGKKIKPMSFGVNPRVPHVNMMDMPTINERYRSKPYCYAYGVVFKSDFKTFGNFSIVKKDVCGSSGDLSWNVADQYPMESWFVPDPNGSREDDGVLLTPMLDGKLGKSYLVILDPKTMKPISKAQLPILVPFHFHGRFINNVY